MKKVIVIGAGPAGLAAAIFARRAGAAVTLVERNPQCGAKLLATGGGRCNAANLRPAAEWPALFGKRGRFIVPALNFLPREALEQWFARLGDPLTAEDGFHLFPRSRSAKNIRDVLRDEAGTLGVTIRTASRCIDILVEGGAATGARLENEQDLRSDAVILATGGASRPATGSDWSGCRIAERLGHTVTPPTPGLVGLRTRSVDPELAGLILPNARVTFKTKGRKEESDTGELLVTHTGVSGPAILDLSASVCKTLAAEAEKAEGQAGVTLRIRWVDEMNTAAWRTHFENTRKTRGSAALSSIIREHIPQRLAKWLCAQAHIDPESGIASLKAPNRDTLLTLLGDFPATITSGEGWDKAMITRGGVDVRQIHPDTLESRLIKNLRFAGEMIDVDGPCGGYNLHWSFAGGALAGDSV